MCDPRPAPGGVSIPAYLTLPPGHTDMRGLPAIVLPHGGPSARDELGFDWLPQYHPHQGYAVLQPNYRGSAGYGDPLVRAERISRLRQTSIGDVTAARALDDLRRAPTQTGRRSSAGPMAAMPRSRPA